MLATVAAAYSANTVRKKYSVFLYSEAEPHAMHSIYKQTRIVCSTVFTFFSFSISSSCEEQESDPLHHYF